LDKPTIQEIEMLRNRKAPGIDEVVPEWEQEKIQESRRMSILCPVYKMDPKNYRGIP